MESSNENDIPMKHLTTETENSSKIDAQKLRFRHPSNYSYVQQRTPGLYKTLTGQSVEDLKRIMKHNIDSYGITSNSYGAISFFGEENKTCVIPFIRFDYNTGLDIPHIENIVTRCGRNSIVSSVKSCLVLDVITGTEHCQNQHLLKSYFRGLIEAAVNLEALILTHGNDPIGSKLMGDAMNELNNKPDMRRKPWNRVLNISTWGCVWNKDILEGMNQWPAEYTTKTEADITSDKVILLNHNSSCFLLVDDGSEGHDEVEEAYCAKKSDNDNIKKILVVIGGDVSMFHRVSRYLDNGHPVLAIGGSHSFIKKVLATEHPNDLINILDFIYVPEMQHVIFSALSRSKGNASFAASLASSTFTRKMQKGWNEDDLCEALFLAAKSGNAVDQARRLQSQGIHFKSFLTHEWLQSHKHDFKSTRDIMQLSLKLLNLDDVNHLLGMAVDTKNILTSSTLWRFYCQCAYLDDDAASFVKLSYTGDWAGSNPCFQKIGKFIASLMNEECLEMFVLDTVSTATNVETPELHLFFMAVLFNKSKLAHNCLRHCQNSTATALYGTALLKKMISKASEDEQFSSKKDFLDSMKKFSVELEQCAVNILNNINSAMESKNNDTLRLLCQESDVKDSKGDSILLRENISHLGGMTPLDFIQTHQLKEAASCTAVQTTLTRIWTGKMKDKLNPNSFGTSLDTSSPPKTNCTLGNSYITIRNAISSPQITYFTNVMANIFILTLFSIFLLTELRHEEYSWKEITVWVWFVGLMLEEIKQMLDDNNTRRTKKRKLAIWWSNNWNKCDAFMYIWFIKTLMMRFFCLQEQFKWVRYSYCSTFVLQCMRCLHLFYVNEHLGPKIVMVGDMARDLIRFLLILLVPIISFGTAYQSIINRGNSELTMHLIPQVLTLTFFQMFGELSLDQVEDEIKEKCSIPANDLHSDPSAMIQGILKHNDTGNFECTERFMANILIGVYVLMTNLFISLLTASVFNKTLEAEKKKMKTWKYHRIALIQEFSIRSILPPFAILELPGRMVHKVYVKRFVATSHDRGPQTNSNLYNVWFKFLRISEQKCTEQYIDSLLNDLTEMERMQMEMQAIKNTLQQLLRTNDNMHAS